MERNEAASTLLADLGVDLDPELLVLALTHRSFAHEAGGIPTNERLEFLGDSVLSIVVTEYLYRQFPEKSEGDLAKIRAASVSQTSLAEIARGLRLGDYVLLGKGELAAGGRDKDSILADTLEAVFGAVYLAHGLEPSRGLIEGLITATLARSAELGVGSDYKTGVQELAAELGMSPPEYDVDGTGPDHARTFHATLRIDGAAWGTGSGTSKNRAEQQAAQVAYHALHAEGKDQGNDA